MFLSLSLGRLVFENPTRFFYCCCMLPLCWDAMFVARGSHGGTLAPKMRSQLQAGVLHACLLFVSLLSILSANAGRLLILTLLPTS